MRISQTHRVIGSHTVRVLGVLPRTFERFTHRFAKWSGTTMGFAAALFTLVLWCVGGKASNFSDSWKNDLELYISICTFLMIFLFQRAENKDIATLNTKLNELIAATQGADNKIITVEDLTEREISEVQQAHRGIVQDTPAEQASHF